MQYSIFTIDFHNNPFAYNVFIQWMNDLDIGYKPVIGNYKGVRENAFIVNRVDFDTHIRGCIHMQEQDSVLHVAGGNKMETELEYLEGSRDAPAGTVTPLGCMHVVCSEEAMQSDNWTYRPDTDTYWIAKPGNPDGSYRRSIEEYRDTGPVFDNTDTARHMAAE